MRDRPGHGTVPQLVTSLRRSLRPVSVPRFGVSIRELATLLPSSPPFGQVDGHVRDTTRVRDENRCCHRHPQRLALLADA